MGDKCDSWIFVNTENLSVKFEIMQSGTREQLHFHSIAQQFFFVLKGNATFYLGNEKQIISEQKGLLIYSKIEHYVINEAEEPLEFVVISQPSTNKDRTTIS